MHNRLIFSLLFFFSFSVAYAGKGQPPARIAFWNVENLFDTINDPNINDEEFLPGGKKKWTSERYTKKLDDLSKVILALGAGGKGPDVLGMAEVENKNVLSDLTQKTDLKKQGYGIVHYDSPDKRGIDVAMIYKMKTFKVLGSQTINVSVPQDTFYTRDILLVKGVLGKKDTLFIFVNHWPSRRGGQEASENKRMLAARSLMRACDSIYAINPNAQVLVMGDFNDEPVNKSMRYLCESTGFFNLMDTLKAAGEGSYQYKKERNLLDQVLVTQSLRSKTGYYVTQAVIFKPEWITGVNYKNDPPGPLHTYAGSHYIGGYSDHYPVYAELGFAK